MKKILVILMVLVCSMSFLFANGGKESKLSSELGGKETWGEEPTGTTEVVIWTFYGETMKGQYQKIVDAFNASQTKYHVTVEFQGSQNELVAKISSTAKSELPAGFHGAVENGSQFMTSDYCVPLQYFMDLDEGEWKEYESTWSAIKAAYQDKEGTLWAYPQGYSYGALFYNIDMCEANGIDVSKLNCLDDLLEACRKLKAAGVATPIGFHPDGFYFNELLGREGLMYYDNDNGYSGDITKCLYLSDSKVYSALEKMLTFYQTVSKEGLCVQYGANYQKEVLPEMGAQNCCFFIGVVSITTKILKVADGKFQVGVRPLVSITKNGSRKGEMAGGTGMFVCDNGNRWAQQGLYEFIKFASQGEWAGYFAAETGYLAPNEEAYNSQVYQDFLKACPTFSSIYDSLAKSDSSANNPFIPIATEMKAANKLATMTVTSDVNASIADAIKTANDTIQEAIDLYNLSN